MSAMSSDCKEHSGKKYSTQWILQMFSFCAKGAKVGCRLGVWDLNTFRVSLAPFRVGEGSSFSLFLGPFEPICFKDVCLMDPEAPNIFHRALCRQKQRPGKKEVAHGLCEFPAESLSLGTVCRSFLSVEGIFESFVLLVFFKIFSYWQVQLTFEVATESIHGSRCIQSLCFSPCLL